MSSERLARGRAEATHRQGDDLAMMAGSDAAAREAEGDGDGDDVSWGDVHTRA